ncbi:MAG TPA: PEPxxWA-CTERM sorting domain-containing protein [Pirellulales bacterium]
MRFTNNGVTSTMSFFSDVESGEPLALADTGFPDNFNFAAFAFTEIGMENGLNGFIYNAGPGDPALTNIYTGISDTVPEPATWALMLLGFVGLGLAAYRRPRITAWAA